MTELRVTTVVALGLTGVVALWLLAVLVAGGFNLPRIRRVPPPWSVEELDALLCRARPQRTTACLRLFR